MSIAKDVIQKVLSKVGFQTTEQIEAQVAARTEQLRKTVLDLERAYDITLEALVVALGLKDAEAEGHSKRVTVFTIAMTRALGMPGDKIRVIARGACLHDIGKMAIPDSILRKPGALTQEESAIMQQHCFRGFQMLRKIPFLNEAVEIGTPTTSGGMGRATRAA